MKQHPLLFAVFALLSLLNSSSATDLARPRLCVLTDIGGDPDDQQSLVRLLIYANEFEIEGLLATSSGTLGELADATPRTDLIHATIDAYGAGLPNLTRHAAGWPEPAALHAVVHAGRAERGRAFIGESHDTAASRWLIARIDAGSAQRPLNIAIWGGQTDLAQALWRVRHDRSPAAYEAFVTRFRVFDTDDQDRIASWMRSEFPGLRYLLAQAPTGQNSRLGTYRGMYLTGDESLTSREWIDQNIRSTGPLGARYPTQTWTDPNSHRCLKEGDTPSWFFFLPVGGNNPVDPTQPGWGGRYQREPDGWYRDLPITGDFDPRTTVSQHRTAYQADFARRMAWCEPQQSARH
jgi:hypothetical protein